MTFVAGTQIVIKGNRALGKHLAGFVAAFYQPQQGAIYLDGVDISEFNLAEYRRK